MPVVPADLRSSGSSNVDGRLSVAALLVIVLVSGVVITSAMRRTSTTFDEICLVAGGARGYDTGRFDLAPEHPPLMQYIYGLPVYLSKPRFPDEAAIPAGSHPLDHRYFYAQRFFFEEGNDPERLAFLGRLPAVACVVLLIGSVYIFVAPRHGRGPGIMAAALTAFMPDVLAHGGVAYNDAPLAAAVFAAVWAMDSAARQPTPAAGAIAGCLLALALSVKFSAVALVPIGALLLSFENLSRPGDRRWSHEAGRCLCVAAFTTYVALVGVYLGDFTLSDFRYGLDFTFRHVSQGHERPGYLLGQLSQTGWWYFFPVAFLFKTPVALHGLTLIGVAGLGMAARDHQPKGILSSPLRAPLLAILVLGAALLTSNLVIGFRYALPILPLMCVAVAAGAGFVWRRGGRLLQAIVVCMTVWFIGSSLSYYPNFLAYVSEYGPGRGREHEVLLDSSVDWGQGLLALRDWMRAEQAERVYLSYFGSARPHGYGIHYLPLPSFRPLVAHRVTPSETAPSFAVISATNLHGVYLDGDPFACLRESRPYTVLAHTLFVYQLESLSRQCGRNSRGWLDQLSRSASLLSVAVAGQ